MNIRFDFSEKISTDKFISSLKELISFNRNGFTFDVHCSNNDCDYKISLINENFSDKVYIMFLIKSGDRDYHYFDRDFLSNAKELQEVYDNCSFNYSIKNVDVFLNDFINLIKYTYYNHKTLLFI